MKVLQEIISELENVEDFQKSNENNDGIFEVDNEADYNNDAKISKFYEDKNCISNHSTQHETGESQNENSSLSNKISNKSIDSINFNKYSESKEEINNKASDEGRFLGRIRCSSLKIDNSDNQSLLWTNNSPSVTITFNPSKQLISQPIELLKENLCPRNSDQQSFYELDLNVGKNNRMPNKNNKQEGSNVVVTESNAKNIKKLEHVKKSKFLHSIRIKREEFENQLYHDSNILLFMNEREYNELLTLYKSLRPELYIAQTRRHNVLVVREFLETKYFDYFFKTSFYLLCTTNCLKTKNEVVKMLELLFRLEFLFKSNTLTTKESIIYENYNEKYVKQYGMRYPLSDVCLTVLAEIRKSNFGFSTPKNKKLISILDDAMTSKYADFITKCNFKRNYYLDEQTKKNYQKENELKNMEHTGFSDLKQVFNLSNYNPTTSVTEEQEVYFSEEQYRIDLDNTFNEICQNEILFKNDEENKNLFNFYCSEDSLFK